MVFTAVYDKNAFLPTHLCCTTHKSFSPSSVHGASPRARPYDTAKQNAHLLKSRSVCHAQSCIFPARDHKHQTRWSRVQTALSPFCVISTVVCFSLCGPLSSALRQCSMNRSRSPATEHGPHTPRPAPSSSPSNAARSRALLLANVASFICWCIVSAIHVETGAQQFTYSCFSNISKSSAI